MPLDPIAVGQRIRELRTRKNWTVERLGVKTDLSVSCIYKVEQGRQCDLDTFVAIVEALETTADWLIFGNVNRKRG